MAKKTPIDQGLIARVANNIKNAVRDAWFGPLEPLTPMVTAEQQPSVVGRQFDFPVGINRNTQPRSTDAVSFPQLRGLADACDVLRVVIETRKDQISKMKWTIKPKDDDAEPDSRCDEVQSFLEFPDKEHDWDTWLRMLLEDLFVIDAPTLYVRKTLGGKLYSLDPVDGATVKRVLDNQGRTPVVPDPAYQQVLKGVPVINYTREELIYRPRNVRTNKIYGYSPVEQIIMTVNIALRRAVHKLQYYTEGNVPEAVVGTPVDWNPDQIALFQKHWDALNEGNTAERRHMKFVPGKLDIVMTKEEVLKDAFDEWLARIVCFAFSIEPTAFVHQTNRATAESAREAALAEGLAPIQQWIQNLINYIIWNVFGYPDLKFDWDDEEVQDPLERAQVNQIYLNAGVLLPNEVREDLGLDDFTPEQLAEIAEAKAPPPPAVQPGLETQDSGGGTTDKPKPPDPNAKPVKPAAPNEKVAKAKKVVPGPINRDRAAVKKLRNKMVVLMTDFLSKQAKIIAAQVSAKINKAETPEDQAGKIIDEVDIAWNELVPEVAVILGAVATEGAKAALKEVGSSVIASSGSASDWAAERSAEMVGMKWVDGALVENPDAKWVITDSTREMIQLYTSEAISEGMTTDELAEMFEESFAFSPERAEMIARTETANADSAGQMQGYKDSGVVEGTEWTTAEDDKVDDECVLNGEAGVILLGELYPSGDEAPPAHPNCRCAIIASLIPEDDDSEKIDKVDGDYMRLTHVLCDLIEKGGPGSGPHGHKPTTAVASSIKGKVHELLSSGHSFTVDELHAITGGTKSSVTTALSDLKNPKYAGAKGPLNIVSANGSHSVVSSDKPASVQGKTVAETLQEAADKVWPPQPAAVTLQSLLDKAGSKQSAPAEPQTVKPSVNVMTKAEADKVYAKDVKAAYDKLGKTGDAQAFKDEKHLAMTQWSANTSGKDQTTTKQTVFGADKTLTENAKAGMEQGKALAQWKTDTNAEKMAANTKATAAIDEIKANIAASSKAQADKIAASDKAAAQAKTFTLPEVKGAPVQTVPGSFVPISGSDFKGATGNFGKGMSAGKALLENGSGTNTDNKGEVEKLLTTGLKNSPSFQAIKAEADASPGASNQSLERRLVGTWAGTSGDSHDVAVAMQLAIRDTFGMKSEDLENKALGLLNNKSEVAIFQAAAMGLGVTIASNEKLAQFKQGLQEFAKAQYDATQKFFSDRGITEMHLARGMKVDSGTASAKSVTLKLQPASSFSVDLTTARSKFSGGQSLFLTKIPVSQILGTYRTGYGCSGEYEVVVLAHSNLKAVQVGAKTAGTSMSSLVSHVASVKGL